MNVVIETEDHRRTCRSFADVVAVVAELAKVAGEARGRSREARIALGTALLQARRALPTGEAARLYERAGINRKTAHRAIRVAAQFGSLSPDLQQFAQSLINRTKPSRRDTVSQDTRVPVGVAAACDSVTPGPDDPHDPDDPQDSAHSTGSSALPIPPLAARPLVWGMPMTAAQYRCAVGLGEDPAEYARALTEDYLTRDEAIEARAIEDAGTQAGPGAGPTAEQATDQITEASAGRAASAGAAGAAGVQLGLDALYEQRERLTALVERAMAAVTSHTVEAAVVADLMSEFEARLRSGLGL